MKIKWANGDMIKMAKEGYFDAIGHGCNCFHTMGSGIAPLMNEFSNGDLLEVDKKTSLGDINKLGDISYVDTQVYLSKEGGLAEKNIRLFNLYTQYNFGNSSLGQVYVHWKSFESALYKMVDRTIGKNIAIPLIGCGLAGGKIEDFKAAVNQVAWSQSPDKTLHIVVLDKGIK